MVKDYSREVTHQSYKNSEKLKKYYHRVQKQIYKFPDRFDNNYLNHKFSDYIFLDENIIVSKTGSIGVPLIGVLLSLSLALFLPLANDAFENIFLVWSNLCCYGSCVVRSYCPVSLGGGERSETYLARIGH